MNTLTDSDAIFQYHRYMIMLHGNHGTAALGWRDIQSQAIRFEAIKALADMNKHTVLDAGCGHGDLFPFMRSYYPEIFYCGIEQIPELLNEARRRYSKWPQTSFMCGDFINGSLPIADYVIACGSLNYHNNDPEFIFKAIAKLYGHSKLGFAFNLLSHVIPNGLIVAYNQDEIMKYCLSLSKQVILKNDYSDEDFTIFIYR